MHILKPARTAAFFAAAVCSLMFDPMIVTGRESRTDKVDKAALPPEELLVGYITASYTPEEKTAEEVLMPDGGCDRWPEMVRSVAYEGVEALSGIPEEIGVQIWDRGRNTAGYGRLSLISAEPLRSPDGAEKSYWKDDFSMVVTFRAYGAETYELNGKRIRHQEDTPPLWGSEEELLGLIGAGTEDYQITDIEWLGESYPDDYGILYRNARVTGLRRVTDYQAVYQGTAVFPEIGEEHMALPQEPAPDEQSLPAETETPVQELESITAPENAPEQEPAPSQPKAPEPVSLPDTIQATPAETGSGQDFFGKRMWREAKEGFEQFSRQLEQWVYDRFSIYIPSGVLMGASLIVLAAGLVCFVRIRRKNSL